MDLDELRAFLLVSETGSIAQASAALAISRATIKRRVEALEARIGAALLKRDVAGGGFDLTPAGELLAARGRVIVREAETLSEALRSAAGAPIGRIRAAVPPGVPPFLGVSVLAMWRARFPDLRVHLQVCEDPLAALLEDADIALCIGEPAPTMVPPLWTVLRLASIREWLVGSDAYLARRGTPTCLAELADHELVVWQAPGDEAGVLATVDGPLRVEPRLVSADIYMLRRFAMAGYGLVYAPDGLLPDPEEAKSPLRPVLPEVVGRMIPVCVVASSARTANPALRAILSQLTAFMESATAAVRRPG